MAYRVLIVEDQDIPRELFKIYIDSSDKFEHVLSIANASAAVTVCQINRIDLVLMDVMTELDHSGLDAAEEITTAWSSIWMSSDSVASSAYTSASVSVTSVNLTD